MSCGGEMNTKTKIIIGLVIALLLAAGLFVWFKRGEIFSKADVLNTTSSSGPNQGQKVSIGIVPDGSARIYPPVTGEMTPGSVKNVIYDKIISPYDIGLNGVLISIVPNPGYRIDPVKLRYSNCSIEPTNAGGSSVSSFTNTFRFRPKTTGCEITAYMQENESAINSTNNLTISVNPEIGGQVFPKEIQIVKDFNPYPGAIELPVTAMAWPAQGYTFDKWTFSGQCKNNSAKPDTNKLIFIDWMKKYKERFWEGDCQVTANFKGPKLNVTGPLRKANVYVAGNQITNDYSEWQPYGNEVSLKAGIIMPGTVWKSWYVNDASQCKFAHPSTDGLYDNSMETTIKVYGECRVSANTAGP